MFFAQFPEYAQQDFVMSGESYAGHYLPAVGKKIVEANAAKEGSHINLKVHHNTYLEQVFPGVI